MSELTALLGIHDDDFKRKLSDYFSDMGYRVDLVSSVEEMLARIGQREYQAYMMDINLGMPGSLNITPAVKVYGAVRPQIESQRAKFLGISGKKQAVEAAEREGIPVLFKRDITLERVEALFKGT